MSLVPPGVVPNYVDPPNHRKQTIILHTICLTLVTTTLFMRLYTRFLITKSGGIDDYFIIFSWAATVAWSGVLLGSENYGIGRHLWDIPLNWIVPGLKLLLVSELMYTVIAPATKLSLLLCFLRIFHASRTMRYFIWVALVAIVIFYIVTFFDTLFICKPMALAWDPFLKGTCQPRKALPYASGVFGFITDFYIFLLPVPNIWGLNMPKPKKIRLILAFGVGLFACIASIVRFAYTIRLLNHSDETWDYIALSIWAVLEIDIGIVCACLHTFPAFMQHHIPEKWRSYMDSYGNRFLSYIKPYTQSESLSRGGRGMIPTLRQSNDSYQNLDYKDQDKLSSKQEIYAGADEFDLPMGNRENQPRSDAEWLPLREI